VVRAAAVKARWSACWPSVLKEKSINVAGVVPYDQALFEACFKGQAIARGKVFQAAEQILTGLFPRTDR